MKYFEQPVYEEWRKKRYRAIIDHYGEDFFNNKKVLEVGAANGDFGAMFRALGANVTSCEGRDLNFQQLLEKNPEQNPTKINFEEDKIEGEYDIIIHVGLLYHLFNFEDNLKDCLSKCKHLILETEVVDSARSGYWVEYEDSTADQGANIQFNRITRPTCEYLEKILTEANFKFELPKNPGAINTSGWIYNWQRGGINSNTVGLRQMWFCEKK